MEKTTNYENYTALEAWHDQRPYGSWGYVVLACNDDGDIREFSFPSKAEAELAFHDGVFSE